MSFYLRTSSGRVPNRNRASMRIATSVILAGYPIGGLIALNAGLAGDGAPAFITGIAGLAVMALSVLTFFYIAPSYMQRIVGEQVCELDDLERDLRQKAFTFAYQVLTGLAAAGIFYLAVANDQTRLTLWAPQSYEHWNTIFWGVLLYSFTLPTAYLAWTMPDLEPDLAEDGADAGQMSKPRMRWWFWGLMAAGGLFGFLLALSIT
ncbi:MAG: hypothetical protein JJU26_06805 [Oceanicaulis sp.]|uniref:hypothetical protein n=1 Tax=Glycocaulis sp. TaxID=1969725 RepID=UPI0025C501F2|nr:hypothetical protein [Glycocaulis sp.]MCC5981415.1 hypothetical protein [Oceanicaulis sp.]MCH8521759.1 hypothetical protein [Glycocaulis sp.]